MSAERVTVTSERRVGVRWTIGAVAPEGFEALRLAIWGAHRVFGPRAAYTVCANSMTAAEARERTGDVPADVEWTEASGTLPDWMHPHVDVSGMIEGKAWKFDPLQVYPDRWELSFDNDCILWEMPGSLRSWLEAGDTDRCLIASDVTPSFGTFARWAGDEPRNAGIRGIPPGFDLVGEMQALLREHPVVMTSELDEQGLHVASVSRRSRPALVTLDEVSICSPFPPHLSQLGRCGAHFVGLNDHWLPWDYYGRPATECVREHWRMHHDAVEKNVGVPAGGAMRRFIAPV
jgi:hypothetical protein